MPSASAQERLAARARRISMLRRRVVAAVLASFVLAWGVVAFDGSMGAESTTVASTTGSTTTSTSTSTDTATQNSGASQDGGGSTMSTHQS